MKRREFLKKCGVASLALVPGGLPGNAHALCDIAAKQGAPAEGFVVRGDRRPAINCVYPEAAFLHAGKGGRLIDVTKPPFHAKGDGKTDDTKALVAALDYVMKSREPHFCFRNYMKGSFLLYLPNGVYLVSDTVACSLPVLVGAPPYDNYTHHWVMKDEELKDKKKFPVGRWSNEHNEGIIILGQSRDGTILRLRDNCPGFGAGQSKAVAAYYRLRCGSNVNQHNVLQNLTIDTGRGNPGAVGLRWNASNAGAVRNVTIRSVDKAGIAGMMCDVRIAQGLIQDISVVGFDLGLSITGGAATQVTLEHATLTGQRRNAIQLANVSVLSARDVVTDGAPTALRVESSSHAVVIQSALRGGGGQSAAIEIVGAHLFARDIATEGYKHAIVRDGRTAVESPHVDEYVSGPVLTLETGAPARSMRLPVEDAPPTPHETNLDAWANVDDYGARGEIHADDTAAIQRAMNSGKATIFLPKVGYVVNGTVTIPKTVRRITFLYGCAVRTRAGDHAMFRVAEPSADPLWVQQNLNLGGLFLDHDAQRTVVIEDVTTFFPFIWTGSPEAQPSDRMFPWKPARPDGQNCWRLYRNASPGGEPKKVFVNNALGFAAGGPDARYAVENVTAWCRQVNTEHYHDVNFAFRRSNVWMLGFKSEMNGTYFCALEGTRLEVLGGLYFQGEPKPRPVIVAKDSRVCVTMAASNPENPSDIILKDTTQGNTRVIRLESCPPMCPQVKGMPLIPLLVNDP